MIEFGKIMQGKQTMPFVSFLIGLGMVIIVFHKPYSSKKYLSIPVSKIEGQIIKHGDKCYTYKSQDTNCSEVKSSY